MDQIPTVVAAAVVVGMGLLFFSLCSTSCLKAFY